MVITCKPVYMPVTGTDIKVVSEWHLMDGKQALCEEEYEESDRHFLPQGARVCTKCLNELLRRVDLNLIGEFDAAQTQTPR